MNINKYIMSSIDMCTSFDLTTNECLFILDQIQNATFNNTLETTYLTGKGGIKLSSLDRNKAAKISGSNGYIVGGLLAAQIGEDPEIATSATILTPACEFIEVGSTNIVETEFKAAGTVGNEIPFIYKVNKDMTQGEHFTQAATASATEFEYDPTTNQLTLPTGVFTKGEYVLVMYDYMSKGKKYTNRSDKFPKTCKLVFDLTLEDVCDENIKFHGKLVFPKAKVDGNFDWSIGDSPATGAFSFESLMHVCSKNKELWYLIIPEVSFKYHLYTGANFVTNGAKRLLIVI